MSAVTVKQLADELGVSVGLVSEQVSRLCKDSASWGPHRVVAVATSSNSQCLLHGEAADEIRELLTRSSAGAA